MKRSLGIAAAILLLTVVGGVAIYLLAKVAAAPAPFDALAEAQGYELFSLNPEDESFVEPHFHGWEILGSTEIAEPKTRDRLTNALRRIASWGDPSIACFEPRHGICIKRQGKTIDFVICFHCEWAQIFENGKETGHFLVAPSAQPILDDVLRAANVKLPRPG